MSAYKPGRSWQQKDRIQGLLFDGAMFLANIDLLGSISDTPLVEFSDRRIGLLLGAGVLTQFVGAILKKGPLDRASARIGTTILYGLQFAGLCLCHRYFTSLYGFLRSGSDLIPCRRL